MPRYNSAGSATSLIFTASGDFLPPPNVSLVWVTMCAAGGSGDNATTAASGAGAAIINMPIIVLPNVIIQITVGVATLGFAGGSTSFGTHLSVGGGGVAGGGGVGGTYGKFPAPASNTDGTIYFTTGSFGSGNRVTFVATGAGGSTSTARGVNPMYGVPPATNPPFGGSSYFGVGSYAFTPVISGSGYGWGAGENTNPATRRGGNGFCLIEWEIDI